MCLKIFLQKTQNTSEVKMNNCIVTRAINQLNNLFSKDIACQLAHKSRLIQRSTSKLNPTAFLIVMVVEMSLVGVHSLDVMCQLFMVHGGLKMTSQALSYRLNLPSTVRFLKSIYTEILAHKSLQIRSSLQQKGILGRFKNVYLEDSTSCTLHEKVSDPFKGSGGGASKAGYKIHTIWNAAKNCIEQLLITPGNKTDQSQAFGIISRLKIGDLVLRDLGYFSLLCFRKIEEKGAYFLSRLKSGVKVYTLDGMLINDLAKYIEGNILDSNVMEIEVLLGAKEKLRVRLVACKVPQSVYDQRVRKLRRKSQKNGYTPSKATLRFNRYTFFISNVPKDILASTEMATLYKLRWEIELLFKSFKSDFQVDIIKGRSKNRVECFIISKLIAIMMTTTIFSYLSMDATFLHGKELSFNKFVKWILAHKFLMILFLPEALDYKVMKMADLDIVSLCKQTRSRKTTKELLETESTYNDIYPEITDFKPLTLLA